MGNDRRDRCYLNPQMGVPVAVMTGTYVQLASFAALLSLLQLPIASVLVQS